MEHGELTVQQGRWGSVVMTGLSLMQRVALSERVCVCPGPEWCAEDQSWATVLQCDQSNWIRVRSWTWSWQVCHMSCPGGWFCCPWGENGLQSGELCLLLIVNINLVDILMYSHSCHGPLNLPQSISRSAIVCSKCHHSTMTVSISNLTWGNTHLPHPWDRLQAMGALSLLPFQMPFPYPLTYCAQWGLYQWLSARSLWGILPLCQIHSQLAHLSLRDMMHWGMLIRRVAYKGLTPLATWVMLEIC